MVHPRAQLALLILVAVSLACDVPLPASAPTTAPSPTAAPSPTPRPTATLAPTQPAGESYSWNDIGAQESGGLTIEIARVVLADKPAITDVDFSLASSLDNTPVVMAIAFVITNNTDRVIHVHPDQGTVIGGSEQVELVDHFTNIFGDEPGGEIHPGVVKIGGLWFGFRRMSVEDIQSITLIIHAPYDENFSPLGPEIRFDINLSQRRVDPLPARLEHLR